MKPENEMNGTVFSRDSNATEARPYKEWEEGVPIDFAYIRIPRRVIDWKEGGKLRVTMFALIALKRGLDNELYLPMNRILNLLKRKSKRDAGGINERIEKTLNDFMTIGYISASEESKDCYLFNHEAVDRDLRGQYAGIYSDEIKKILEYSRKKTGTRYFNLDATLLVFAYLRMNIYRRKNDMKLLPDKSVEESREIWKAENPECWYGYYEDIAEDVGLTVSMVSTAISILVDLGLIFCGNSNKFKVGNQFISGHKLIVNTYKRSGNRVLASGKDYYMKEFDNRKKQDVKWRKSCYSAYEHAE